MIFSAHHEVIVAKSQLGSWEHFPGDLLWLKTDIYISHPVCFVITEDLGL